MDSNAIKSKSLVASILLVPGGIALNYVLAQLVLMLHIPIFMDSLGTILVTILGGFIPGMLVGFSLNMLNGLKDPITLYYGIISIMFVPIIVFLAKKGCFSSLKKAWKPILLMTAIGGAFGSCLTWLLYGRSIGRGISAPYTMALVHRGMSLFSAQFTADVIIDLVDKCVIVFLAITILKVMPESFYRLFPYRLINITEDEVITYRKVSLRTQVIIALSINSLFVGGISTYINSLYHRRNLISIYTNISTGIVNMDMVNRQMVILITRNISIVFAVSLLFAMLVLIYCDYQFVVPINNMTKYANMFAFKDKATKKKAENLLLTLKLNSGDEIESLQKALQKMTHDTNEYIKTIEKDIDQITKLRDGMILCFADLVEGRDDCTGMHIKHTAKYVSVIAHELQKNPKYKEILTDEYIKQLVILAPLHDIGKIKIPDEILNKPGKLTDEEFELVKKHTIYGELFIHQIRLNVDITDNEFFQIAVDMAVAHHERYDGKGYPYGLNGESIPLAARIMAVSDVFDALVSKRSYKEGYDTETALQIIKDESGTHFDPDVVEAFVAAFDQIAEC